MEGKMAREDRWYRNGRSRKTVLLYKVFCIGVKKVFSTREVRPDYKFSDQDNNAKWFVLNGEPLQKQIETFGAFL
jgi:hypothetical protein